MISYLTILTIFVRSVRYKLPFARKSQNCEKKLQLPFLFFILWWEKKQLREVNLELREVKIRNLKLTVLTFWKKFTFCNSDFSKSQEGKSELWDKSHRYFYHCFFILWRKWPSIVVTWQKHILMQFDLKSAMTHFILLHFRVCLHDNDVLKQIFFFALFRKVSRTEQSPFTRIWIKINKKKTKNAVSACQTSSWRCHFVKKHYVSAHIPIGWTCNMHGHNIAVFINLHFCSSHRNSNAIVFNNVHFKTCFQKFAFSGVVMLINGQKHTKGFPSLVENVVM